MLNDPRIPLELRTAAADAALRFAEAIASQQMVGTRASDDEFAEAERALHVAVAAATQVLQQQADQDRAAGAARVWLNAQPDESGEADAALEQTLLDLGMLSEDDAVNEISWRDARDSVELTQDSLVVILESGEQVVIPVLA